MIRAFIALNIPVFVKEKLFEISNSISQVNDFKWESRNKLHLTLKFIGDVEESSASVIANELSFLESHHSLKCVLNGFDFFYRDKKPVILYADLKVSNSTFTIVDEIETRLEKYSIKKETRIFNPHLTMLRIKNDIDINFVHKFKNFTFEPIVFVCNSVTLFKSELHKSGSKYFEIKNYKLKELEK